MGGEWKEFHLKRNLRNFPDIRKLSRKYLSKLVGENDALEFMPENRDTPWPGFAEEKTGITPDNLNQTLTQAIQSTLQEHPPGGIMILTSESHANITGNGPANAPVLDIAWIKETFPKTVIGGAVPAITDDMMFVDTIRRTKGLEADAVIAVIADKTTNQTDEKNTRMKREMYRLAYIAATRARRRLHVIWVTMRPTAKRG